MILDAHANSDLLVRELGSPGKNQIAYTSSASTAVPPITLNTYRSRGYETGKPVVIVQHGMLRNGDDYRDFWVAAADKHDLLVVAPTYSSTHWPKSEHYNNGHILKEDGGIRDANQWAYTLTREVTLTLCRSGLASDQQIYLFGHSAGGQFVHRYLSCEPHEPVRKATAANSGWYTLPTFDHPFPEGLAGIGLAAQNLVRLLGYPLTILAGEQDIITDEPSLPANPEAKKQGPHRFARARNYYETGKHEAGRLGVPFNWELITVPHIGHDGCAMSAVCASLWFESRMPDEATLQKLAQQHVA